MQEMSTQQPSTRAAENENEPRAPARPLSGWKRFRLIIRVIELRLRFIVLMAITGATFGYWDTIWTHYQKWRHPHAGQISFVDVEYYCPMHPRVVREQNGVCPMCGMPLSHRKMGDFQPLPDGVVSRVTLPPWRIDQAGIQTTSVEYAPLMETVETVGRVDYDERSRAIVSSKIRGMSRVERLFVNFEGTDVKPDQPLAELYAPELDQAIEELLLAQKAAEQKPQNTSPLVRSVLGDPTERLRAAEQKLERWGITPEAINRVRREGRSQAKLTIYSPIGGHVTRLNVRAGQYVSEGEVLFELAELGHVWVVAQVFEDQLSLVRMGQNVQAMVRSFPGETFQGTVAFVQPHVDPMTRTLDVRFDLQNEEHKLRPGMYAKVSIKSPVADSPAFRERAADARVRRSHDAGSNNAEDQKTCPVSGAPIARAEQRARVQLAGRQIWTCCLDCARKLKASPSRYLTSQKGAASNPPPRDAVLSIPEDAVIDTGSRRIVYVETAPGVFDGREVVLGPRSGDRFPVLEGLEAGERVAAAGAFLIDAEARLNPLGAIRQGGDGAKSPANQPEQAAVTASGSVR
jgi:Cu(I)/Ag(I) efflux system membrane fusion protein